MIKVGNFYRDDQEIYLALYVNIADDSVIASVLHTFEGRFKDSLTLYLQDYSYELSMEANPHEITLEEAVNYLKGNT